MEQLSLKRSGEDLDDTERIRDLVDDSVPMEDIGRNHGLMKLQHVYKRDHHGSVKYEAKHLTRRKLRKRCNDIEMINSFNTLQEATEQHKKELRKSETTCFITSKPTAVNPA